ncbi:hypothetical protein ACTMTI_01410 [Nonomuraea sp. H19]|uniref:hypothetical protein n=1 Tax=Nonomuraea sp. H19 TaxID=3452206 RepID=UPI003F8CD76E
MATKREIHITSSCIAKTRVMVEVDLKDDMIGFVKGLAPETALSGQGFGVLGDMIIGATYEGIRKRADELLREAEITLVGGGPGDRDGWTQALTVCQRNWRAAEEHSVVRYRA